MNKLKIILFLGILFFLNITFVGKIHAATITTTIGYFCSNNGSTIWGVQGTYNKSTGATIPISGTANSTLNASSLCNSVSMANGPAITADHYYLFNIDSYLGTNADSVTWHTACVDPTTNIHPTITTFTQGSEQDSEFGLDISCHPLGYNSTPGQVYAGCGTNYNNMNRTIAASATCPTNTCYHTVGGVTDYPTSSCGQVPPTPTNLQAAPFCNANASLVTYTWDAVSGASSYRVSWAGQTEQVVTTNSYTVNPTCTTGPGGCSFTYNNSVVWYVKACNATGCSVQTNGPTYTSWTCNNSTLTIQVGGPGSATAIPTNHSLGNCSAVNTNFNIPATCTGSTFGTPDNVYLSANAVSGYVFNGWSVVSGPTLTTANPGPTLGTISPCSGNPCTINLGQNTTATIKANYGTPTPTPTITPTPTLTPTITPTPPPASCAVTTSPTILNLSNGGTGTVTAIVSSGLGSATISQMRFGSYNTGLATVNPTSDATSPYSTTVTGVASGSTAVWATADLSDGRTCQSSGTTDSDVNIAGPTATNTPTPTVTPTNTPTPTPTNTPTPTPTPVPTYSITGNIYVDANNNGVKDASESYYSGATLTLSGAGSATTTTDLSGNYSFTNNNAGSYTVTLTVPSGYTGSPTSQAVILGPSKTANFRLVPISSVTVHVYNDFNGNGFQDSGETDSSGRTVTVTGQGAGTYTTNSSGVATLSNLTAGSSTITVTIPSGWTSTTTNPRTITLPPTQTVNFGTKPPAPSCAGGLSANPTTVNPGQTSALSLGGCTSPTGDPLSYTWPAPDYGSTADVNSPSTTWTSPNPYWNQVTSHPSVTVCVQGSALCTSYGTQIIIIPLFSITGSVFVDQNKDQLKNGSEPDYSGTISISPNPTGASVTYPTPGNYQITGLTGGSYTIYYSNLPAGYQLTFPLNGPPPSFGVSVGNATTGSSCSVGGSNSATCTNGNISSLRYGITNSIPWIQSIGGDITGGGVTTSSGGGFTDQIPQGATCGAYASLTGTGGSPGVVYSGAGTADFGLGQASQNPYNWVVGGLSYPEPINVSSPLITSYAYVNSTALASGTIHDIASYCGAGGIANCNISPSIPSGFYKATGNLNITGSSFTFPGNTSSPKNFIILVTGDLSIQTEIHVPVGDTAFFSVLGNIYVDKSVGESTITSTRSNVEGYYSTDNSFFVQGNNSCPTVDLRLNVAGAIVVNAGNTGGSFVNQRDLCAGDLQCPVFSIAERPDFVLYSPEYLKVRRVWQEVAP